MKPMLCKRTFSAVCHRVIAPSIAVPRRTSSLVCRCQIAGPSSFLTTRQLAADQLRRLGVCTVPSSPSPHCVSEVDEDVLASIAASIGPLSTAPVLPPPAPVVVVISGPSGVGKDTVVHELKARRPDLYFVVTATSRTKRPGEVEGRDYFFVTKEKFESWINEGQMLEHAVVYGEYKGIPKQQVQDALNQGTDVVLRLDVQGAATIKKLIPDVLTIFIVAENEESLVRRLVARKTESLDRMVVRVQTARAELARAKEFDYVVENKAGQLEDCVCQVAAIIDAHKLRRKEGQQLGAA